MGEGAWCYYRYKRHCRKAQDRRMQSGSTAGFSRLQLYLYSGRRNLPSPVGWSQKDGASSGGLGCKEKLLQQHWKQLQKNADGSGFGQGQVCSSSAQGCALLVRSHPGKKTHGCKAREAGQRQPEACTILHIFTTKSVYLEKPECAGWMGDVAHTVPRPCCHLGRFEDGEEKVGASTGLYLCVSQASFQHSWCFPPHSFSSAFLAPVNLNGASLENTHSHAIPCPQMWMVR